ncbi:transposase zinc-binding domain-containing protein [Pyxidicoccus sp. 3LFB2]
MECGVLAHGFARVRCEGCKDELLVAFSSKGRGLCPSCACSGASRAPIPGQGGGASAAEEEPSLRATGGLLPTRQHPPACQ